MSAPDLGLFENAAEATFWSPAFASAFDLTQLYGAGGAALATQTANGCTASAMTDFQGNVIITFQGTTTAAQNDADQQIMAGDDPASIPAFADALAFTRTVQQAAAGLGIPAANIYVTGHSLGGTLAEYVASQTGLAGISFAGAGLPGYVAPATPAANFTSYVEHGDAYANWSTDGSEHVLASASQDHYGQLTFLGPSANDALTDLIVADTQALIPALFTGTLATASAKLAADFNHNLLGIHSMGNYVADLAAMPAPNLTGGAFRDAGASIAQLHPGLFASF